MANSQSYTHEIADKKTAYIEDHLYAKKNGRARVAIRNDFITSQQQDEASTTRLSFLTLKNTRSTCKI